MEVIFTESFFYWKNTILKKWKCNLFVKDFPDLREKNPTDFKSIFFISEMFLSGNVKFLFLLYF